MMISSLSSRCGRGPCATHRDQRGLTLVELMVGLVVGLVVVAAMSGLFVSSSNARREVERSVDMIENGRYGISVLERELSQTGFYGTLTNTTGATNLPCSTTLSEWQDSLSFYVRGYNNAEADPGCLNRKPNTDAVFVQRVSTCAVGDTGCAAENANHAYLQVSECGSEYSSPLGKFVLAAGLSGTGTFNLQTKTCAAPPYAERRQLIRRIFFITPQDVLSYQDIRLDGAQPPVALVENIEQMQLEYGFDTNNDGTVDVYGTAPPAGADWSAAIGVRVWLLARSSTPSTLVKDATSYQMSDTLDIDGSNKGGVYTVPAATRNFKRRLYSTYIPFVTPKARRES